MTEKIKLLEDLPLAKKHGCLAGREYDVIRYEAGKFFFMGDAGEECAALTHEIKYWEEEQPRRASR